MWKRNFLPMIMPAAAAGMASAANPWIEYTVSPIAPLTSDGAAIDHAGVTVAPASSPALAR
ncbi:hypothetical protein ABIB38_003464 [Massilia sp. UYP11]|uniref:hypothetical protein n=1 Tax=Massilia sp. UYP11 TaxID=1756385 RepID=UPI003D25D4BC